MLKEDRRKKNTKIKMKYTWCRSLSHADLQKFNFKTEVT